MWLGCGNVDPPPRPVAAAPPSLSLGTVGGMESGLSPTPRGSREGPPPDWCKLLPAPLTPLVWGADPLLPRSHDQDPGQVFHLLGRVSHAPRGVQEGGPCLGGWAVLSLRVPSRKPLQRSTLPWEVLGQEGFQGMGVGVGGPQFLASRPGIPPPVSLWAHSLCCIAGADGREGGTPPSPSREGPPLAI